MIVVDMGRQRPGHRRVRRGRHAEAARDAVGTPLTSGRAQATRVEQAAVVLGTTLTYAYSPTGRAWHARLHKPGGLRVGRP